MDAHRPAPIPEFYSGRSLLVTGASGFMGKVLLEKLLYDCPDVGSIYVLMRPKRDKQPSARIDDMFKLPLFARVRSERPDAQKKLLILEGDVSKDNLGLTEDQVRRVIKDVSIVFHCAATLRLEAKLKDAIQMNLIGTFHALELSKGMEKLKAFVYLSTAFCHCDQAELEERMYPSPYNPHDIMRCVQWMDDITLEMITPRLLEPHPNTYTFSKRLAESLVQEYSSLMPVAIARPAIVTPAWMVPLPGWVDNLNGPTGLLVGAGKGVIRSMHCKPDSYSEVVPVDLAINGLVAIAWKVGQQQERTAQVPVYNITASSIKRLTWAEVLERGRKYIYEYPFEMTVWYPDGNIRSSKLLHNLCVVFLHFLPAYFIDLLMILFFQKRFMVRIQRKIQDGLNILQYFTTRDWVFHSKEFLNLFSSMSLNDRKVFSLDFDAVDEEEYLKNCILGARQYCMKEDLSSLPRCRRNMKVLWVVDKLWSVVFYLLLLWLLVSFSDTARYVLEATGDFLKMMPIVRTLVGRESSSI